MDSDIAHIEVAPIEGGWLLQSPVSSHPLVFQRGGQAERKAYELARLLISLGRTTQVIIRDRNQKIVGSILGGPGSRLDLDLDRRLSL